MLTITKTFTFDSAHQLVGGAFGKCQKVHGHTFKLEVTVASDGDLKDNMVYNFSHLSQIVKENIIDVYDHQFLNDILQTKQPTAEHMVYRIAAIIESKLPAQIHVVQVRLYETPSSFCTWIKSHGEILPTT